MSKKLLHVGLLLLTPFWAAAAFSAAQAPKLTPGADKSPQQLEPVSGETNRTMNRLDAGDHERTASLVAAMSAQIGSIVVVFIAFAIQESRKIPIHKTPQDAYRDEREKSRLHMLRLNGCLSMVALIICPVFVAFAMTTKVLAENWVDDIAIAMFTFGIFVLLLTLVAYLALESPFHYGQSVNQQL